MSRHSHEVTTDMGFLVVRTLIGIFFLAEGIDKLPWLWDPAPLAVSLTKWAQTAIPVSHWYLTAIAIPGVPVFGRLVALGEVCAGLSLITGVWSRYAAAAALLMVMNFY